MKKTIILIHGYLSDYHDFSNLPKYLIKLYDQVIILNLPGHGKYQDINNFKINNTIKMVENEVEYYLTKGSVDIIGFSMGGALARYIASKYQKVNNVVLLAPATKYLVTGFLFKRIKYIFSKKKKIKENYHTVLEHDKLAIKMSKQITIPKFRIKNGITFCKLIKKINKQKTKYDIPTLIIWGKLDELVPKRAIKYCYKSSISNKKQIIYYDDIGHLMLYSAREKDIITDILNFLNGE